MAKTDTPVLDLLAKMTEDSAEYADLDPRSFMIARVAALVAVDAPPVSYMVNLGAAEDFDFSVEDLQAVFAAVAPIVGTARVASAAGHVAYRPAADRSAAGRYAYPPPRGSSPPIAAVRPRSPPTASRVRPPREVGRVAAVEPAVTPCSRGGSA